MIDLTNLAQPVTDIAMAGDVPIPVPDAPPIAPPPLPTPTIPALHNPIPVIVHGAEYAWDDVSSWVSDRWHSLTGIFDSGISFTWDNVKNLVDVALSAEQTAWASFIGTLENWINASVGAVDGAIWDLGTFAVGELIQVTGEIFSVADTVVGWVGAEVAGIDAQIAEQWWNTIQAIDYAGGVIEAWAIDNIAWPLMQEISTEVNRIEATIGADVAALEQEIAGLNLQEIPAILAKLGVIAAAVTAVQTWIDDCGAPMCEQMGPNTDWSKLLKVLNVAGMLALLTSFGTLTESQLEQLAATVVGLGENPAETFVQLFVTEGDTLASAIASTVPSIVP